MVVLTLGYRISDYRWEVADWHQTIMLGIIDVSKYKSIIVMPFAAGIALNQALRQAQVVYGIDIDEVSHHAEPTG